MVPLDKNKNKDDGMMIEKNEGSSPTIKSEKKGVIKRLFGKKRNNPLETNSKDVVSNPDSHNNPTVNDGTYPTNAIDNDDIGLVSPTSIATKQERRFFASHRDGTRPPSIVLNDVPTPQFTNVHHRPTVPRVGPSVDIPRIPEQRESIEGTDDNIYTQRVNVNEIKCRTEKMHQIGNVVTDEEETIETDPELDDTFDTDEQGQHVDSTFDTEDYEDEETASGGASYYSNEESYGDTGNNTSFEFSIRSRHNNNQNKNSVITDDPSKATSNSYDKDGDTSTYTHETGDDDYTGSYTNEDSYTYTTDSGEGKGGVMKNMFSAWARMGPTCNQTVNTGTISGSASETLSSYTDAESSNRHQEGRSIKKMSIKDAKKWVSQGSSSPTSPRRGLNGIVKEWKEHKELNNERMAAIPSLNEENSDLCDDDDISKSTKQDDSHSNGYFSYTESGTDDGGTSSRQTSSTHESNLSNSTNSNSPTRAKHSTTNKTKTPPLLPPPPLTQREERLLKTEKIVLTRSTLSRPFGRLSLPPTTKPWVVEVSPPILHGNEDQWRYRVLVQKQVQMTKINDDNSIKKSHKLKQRNFFGADENSLNSYTSTAASVDRTLQDFVWLERSLRFEYQGALILPLLSLTLSSCGMGGGSGYDWLSSMKKSPKSSHEQLHQNPLLDASRNGSRKELKRNTSNDEKELFASGKWDPVNESELELEKLLNNNTKVDPDRLADWLSDVLNGVRGRGELVNAYPANINIMKSESVETFLYRNSSAPLPDLEAASAKKISWLGMKFSLDMHMPHHIGVSLVDDEDCRVESMSPSLVSKIENSALRLAKITTLACGGGGDLRCARSPEVTTMKFINTDDNSYSSSNKKNITNMINNNKKTSKELIADALDSAKKRKAKITKHINSCMHLKDGDEISLVSIDQQDGMDRSSNCSSDNQSMTFFDPDYILQQRAVVRSKLLARKDAIHKLPISSKIIFSHSLISDFQRERVLVAMYRLKMLLDKEVTASSAWRRFAISLSNLFSIEKEVEGCRVAGGSSSASSSAKKNNDEKNNALEKEKLDDLLRVFARQRGDRAVPSLQILGSMLGALYADLSSTFPSFRARSYSEIYLSNDEVGSSTEEAGSISSNGGDDASSSDGLGRRLLDRALKVGKNDGNNTISSLSPGRKARYYDASMPGRDHIDANETALELSLNMLGRATGIRVSRMAWKFLKMESGQASLLGSAAASLRVAIEDSSDNGNGDSSTSRMRRRREKDEEDLLAKEMSVLSRFLHLGNCQKYGNRTTQPYSADGMSGVELEVNDLNSSLMGKDDMNDSSLLTHSPQAEKALFLASDKAGRWDAELSLTVLEAVGIQDAQLSMEDTTRDLRQVRKMAKSLKECVQRCTEAVEFLKHVELGNGGDSDSNHHHSRHNEEWSQNNVKIKFARERFISSLARVFAGPICIANDYEQHTANRNDQKMKKKRTNKDETTESIGEAVEIMKSIGIDMNDNAGWWKAIELLEGRGKGLNDGIKRGDCGQLIVQYESVRAGGISLMLSKISQLLAEYERRVQNIESFVYVNCVGIQLEKYFSKLRADALADWEKKTDITTAINIASKKRLKLLVQELREKLDSMGPDVSHTSVKEAKERHLASKALKEELEGLARKRFRRIKESSMEKVNAILKLLAEHEESVSGLEQNCLTEAIHEVEGVVTREMIEADGGAHIIDLPKSAEQEEGVL
eukprot:CAMPEP_0184868062 /NCGR_PEP_ID=MMETSP0580-20130426/28950_1 /TAXON_ID=1118495 /ORGANISM="Dactyliosolen fragilissimus" /LENGTH=1707 /DNA_ID=CAMNT_0027368695 /DNA_START=308 /DNA_END=5432 /DNA_ORIENTATION=-